MNKYLAKRKELIVVGIFCFVAVFICGQVGLAEEKGSSHGQGLNYYENNEIDKAIIALKGALVKEFATPASGELQKAVDLAKDSKADEAEKILLSLFDDEESAARCRYELGLIYESQGKLDDAATSYRDALVINRHKGAKYVGAKKCKMCHMKQYKSWAKTKMAKTFEVLKPGVSAEAKTKLKFDPQKDYTKDPKCLVCHTTGFNLPGGYKIPKKGDSKAAAQAKLNEGTTCEACHGPGSKYLPLHKKIMSRKKYTFETLHQAGQIRADDSSCTPCHNRRNPTAGADFHFDYEKYKGEDTHVNIPLKYRIKE